jgi:hypothetical protein
MKFEARPFIMIILASMLLCACFGVAILSPIDMGIGIKPPKTNQQANLDAYNLEALKDGSVGIFEVDLKLAVLPPSSSQEERTLTVEPFADILVYVNDDNSTLDPVEICIDWLDLISESVEGEYIYDIHNFLAEPVCHKIDADKDYLYTSNFIGTEQDFTVENYYNIRMPKEKFIPYTGGLPEIVGQNFWFPYDNFKANIYIQVATSVNLSDGTWVYAQVPAYYDWRLRPSGSRAWDIEMQNTPQILPENAEAPLNYFFPGAYQKVELQFVRPLLFKISFPMLMIAMVLLIAFVPMMKNANVEDILAVMAGLLFATFAIRSIISPGTEIGQTLIDIGIIGLNILQIIAAGLLFVRILRQQRRHKDAQSKDA